MTDRMKLALYATTVDRLRSLRHAAIGRLDCIEHLGTDDAGLAAAYRRGQIDGLESALMALGSMEQCPECEQVFYDAACPCKARERV